MLRPMLCAAGLLGALCAPPAQSCGHCVEDKMAAVYDHAVILRAQAQRQHVAFVAIEGRLGTGAGTQAAIARIVRAVPGVDPASVRVSLELAALSYAYHPQRTSFATVQDAIGPKFRRLGLRASEIKILEGAKR